MTGHVVFAVIVEPDSRMESDIDELVQQFQASIASAKSEPKGVEVGLELWQALKSAGLIEMRSVAAWGTVSHNDVAAISL